MFYFQFHLLPSILVYSDFDHKIEMKFYLFSNNSYLKSNVSEYVRRYLLRYPSPYYSTITITQ